MKIGIDVMGGDFAPAEAIAGCKVFMHDAPEIELVLYGDRELCEAHFNEQGLQISEFNFVHCPEVIGMAESPTKAVTQKRQSSIMMGLKDLAEGQLNAFVSAGNTGAVMVGAMLSVKPVQGVLRPALSTIVPKIDGSIGVLLDVGANSDCKPDVLAQFALLGSLYAQYVFGYENPKVGLLSIGEEKEKGNVVTQATHPLLEELEGINFVGNIEGRDLFLPNNHVAVCDGFTGNILLKACESLVYLMAKQGIHNPFLDRFDYENHGGSPILGINAPVIIGHGISKAKSFSNMLKIARNIVNKGLIEHIKIAFQTY